MSSYTVKGANEMTLQGTGRGWSRTGGETEIQHWRGPQAAAIALFEGYLDSDEVDNVTLSPTGVVRDVIVEIYDSQTTTGGNSPDDNADWELLPLDSMKDLKAHPYFNPSGSIVGELIQADFIMENGEEPDWSEFLWDTYIQRYIGLKNAGVDQFPDNGAVIRKTVRVSKRTSYDVAWDKCNQVVSLDYINPPDYLINNLNQLQRLTRDSALTIPYSDTDYVTSQWEWLKKVPTIRSLAGGKLYEVNYDFWGAEEWSAVLYRGTWDPLPA